MAGRTSHDPRTILEHLCRKRDRTYEEIVVEFCELGRKLEPRGVTITPRHLRRLASGERVGTNPATRRVLQELFGLPIDQLLSRWTPDQESLLIPKTGIQVSGRPGPESLIRLPGVDSLVSGSNGDTLVQARSDISTLALAAASARDFNLRRSVATGTEAIDELTDEVRELALVFPCTPPSKILWRLVNAQDAVLSLLDRQQKPAIERQLYFLGAVVAGMLAYAGDDFGTYDVAMGHTRTAYMWAGYIDHDSLRAWIRGLQSFLCYWAGKPAEAIRYARSGAEFGKATNSTVTPWLLACEARANATLGNAERAKELINSAARAHDIAQPDALDEMGGICTFSHSRFLYYSAGTLARLPNESRLAETRSAQAVEAYTDSDEPAWDYSCLADSRLILAYVLVRRGDLDEVEEILRPVLTLPPERRVQSLVKTMGAIHRALGEHLNQRQAIELREKITTFTSVCLPRIDS